jgi:hypothetical protein
MQTDITVLDRLAVVNLDIHIWSARCKLTPLDLGNAELPPEELASLGSKRICNPDELKTFTTLKARAVSILEKHGIRFLNGWAVPDSRMDKITDELAAVKDEFAAAKESFLLRYEQAVRDWMDKHPAWASIIAGSVADEGYVRSRMDFRWQSFRILPPPNADDRDNLRGDIANLGNTLFGEVASAASETWHRCYAGKTEITRKALSPLKTIHDKLTGLSFMEPRVAPVVELISTAFANVPKRGAINGGVLLMLQGLISLLCNPDALLEHSQRILGGGQKAQDILEGFINDPLRNVQPTGPEADQTDDEPVFDDTAFSAITLESHGLW